QADAATTPHTYPPPGPDARHTPTARRTASRAAGASSPATSTATAAVPPPPPANTAPPTITGTAQQGQTLTEVHGSWTGEPTSFTHQWLQGNSLGEGCLPISGATSQAYMPVAGDVGHEIEVEETAVNAGGSSSAKSAPTAAVAAAPRPTNTAPPTISGTAATGQT